MTARSKPYFWLVCDHPDCEAVSTEGSDWTGAWAEVDVAEEDAGFAGWLITEDGQHYCNDHWMWCDECDSQEPLPHKHQEVSDVDA